MRKILLKNHTSPETAYVVEDYPYGFRLRCRKRYWVHYSKGHGNRLMSQTTNPKLSGEHWNAAKGANYAEMVFMYQIDSPGAENHGHVEWTGLDVYRGWEEFTRIRAEFYDQMDEPMRDKFNFCWRYSHRANHESWGKFWREKATRELAMSLTPKQAFDAWLVATHTFVNASEMGETGKKLSNVTDNQVIMAWIDTLKHEEIPEAPKS